MAGLIPAHAGKTRLHYASRAMYRAHPRSRGENGGVPATAPVPEGSSPLTRGKPCDRAADRLPGGLIPAHAGNTDPRRARQDKGRAHPRSRGENPHSRARRAPRDGSSPLTRGKHGGELGVGRGGGLIPAHAGKTTTGIVPTRARAAHPRSRGENTTVGTMPGAGPGSSPLTRGKRQRVPTRAGGGGLIPAHAGKTSVSRPTIRYPEAHPRSRGENSDPGVPTHTTTGSSPLTRGKRLDRCVAQLTHGLIPAHAGKTTPTGNGAVHAAAHPRSRGENVTVSEGWEKIEGSSPLTRGKRGVRAEMFLGRGLIPAHAGKTCNT